MSDGVGKELLIGFLKYVGTFLGPTILVMLLYKIFEPFAFRDGQFILVFILSIPEPVYLQDKIKREVEKMFVGYGETVE